MVDFLNLTSQRVTSYFREMGRTSSHCLTGIILSFNFRHSLFPNISNILKIRTITQQKKGCECFAIHAPPPIPLFPCCNFFNYQNRKNISGPRGRVPQRTWTSNQWGADVRRSGAGRAERKPGGRGSEVRRGRGAETPPRGPRSPRRPGRTRGAALAPTRRLSRRRGLAGARKPARDPPSSPSPPPAQRAAAAARVLPKRLRPSRLGPESLLCTHLVSSATFLTKRDVLGGRR